MNTYDAFCFLLCAVINAQIAARKSGLSIMYTRPRQQLMRDLIHKYIPEKERAKDK